MHVVVGRMNPNLGAPATVLLWNVISVQLEPSLQSKIPANASYVVSVDQYLVPNPATTLLVTVIFSESLIEIPAMFWANITLFSRMTSSESTTSIPIPSPLWTIEFLISDLGSSSSKSLRPANLTAALSVSYCEQLENSTLCKTVWPFLNSGTKIPPTNPTSLLWAVTRWAPHLSSFVPTILIFLVKWITSVLISIVLDSFASIPDAP